MQTNSLSSEILLRSDDTIIVTLVSITLVNRSEADINFLNVYSCIPFCRSVINNEHKKIIIYIVFYCRNFDQSNYYEARLRHIQPIGKDVTSYL